MFFFALVFLRDVKSGKVYYCGAERLSQLYPVMLTKKYKPAMKAELMEGEEGVSEAFLIPFLKGKGENEGFEPGDRISACRNLNNRLPES